MTARQAFTLDVLLGTGMTAGCAAFLGGSAAGVLLGFVGAAVVILAIGSDPP
jgi:hypothetical protein